MIQPSTTSEFPRGAVRRGPRLGPFLLLTGLAAGVQFGCHATEGSSDGIFAAESARARGDLRGAVAEYDRFIAFGAADDRDRVRALVDRADCLVELGELAAGRAGAARALTVVRGLATLDLAQRHAVESRIETVLGDADLAERDADRADARYRHAGQLDPRGGIHADLLRYRRYLAARHRGRSNADRFLAQIEDRNRPEFRDLDARFPPPLPAAAPVTPMPLDPGPRPIDLGVTVVSRSRWNASPIRTNRDPMTRIQRVTVHHSAIAFDADGEGASASHIRAIQSGHQNGNGWADIGYHFLIDPAGRIWEGRKLDYQGAHAGNADLNRGNVGVCLLGDFSQRAPGLRQTESLMTLLGRLKQHFGIPPNGFYTHHEIRAAHDHGGTACPGPYVTRLLDGFRRGPVAHRG